MGRRYQNDIAGIERNIEKELVKSPAFNSLSADGKEAVVGRIADDFVEGKVLGETTEQTADRLAKEYQKSPYFAEVYDALKGFGDDAAIRTNLRTIGTHVDDLNANKMIQSVNSLSDEDLIIAGRVSRVNQQFKVIVDTELQVANVLPTPAVRRTFREGIREGATAIKDKAKRLTDNIPTQELRKLESRANEVTHGMSRSRVVWIIGAESLEDASILPEEGSYAVQCAAATVTKFSKSGIKNPAKVCALALSLSMVTEQADSINDKYVPAGVNTIGLKIPYQPTRRYVLDEDVLPHYVHLEKDDVGQTKPTFFSASPCKTNYVTTPPESVECLIHECKPESFSQCYYNTNEAAMYDGEPVAFGEPIVYSLGRARTDFGKEYRGKSGNIKYSGFDTDYKKGWKPVTHLKPGEEIDETGATGGISTKLNPTGDDLEINIDTQFDPFIDKPAFDSCVAACSDAECKAACHPVHKCITEELPKVCGVGPNSSHIPGMLTVGKWMNTGEGYAQVIHINDEETQTNIEDKDYVATGEDLASKECIPRDIWSGGTEYITSTAVHVEQQKDAAIEGFCFASYQYEDLTVDILIAAPFLAIDFLTAGTAGVFTGAAYVIVDSIVSEHRDKWPIH